MNHCYLLPASPSYVITLEDGTTQTIQPQQEGKCWTDGETELGAPFEFDADGNITGGTPTPIVAPTSAVFTADWDGSSPYLENVMGTIPTVGLPFAGWPAVDKAAFDAQQPINQPI